MARTSRLREQTRRSLIPYEVFSQPEQLVAAFFEASTVGLAVCDDQLRFQAINETLARMNGIPVEAHLNKTIREVLGNAADLIEPAMESVLSTGRPVSNFEISMQLPTRNEVGHWIENYFPIRDSQGRVRQVGAIVVEISDQRKLEASLHKLTRQLLRAQDDEQRRVARDLHDSVNQYHVALKMNLMRLRHEIEAPGKPSALLSQSIELLDQCMAETRTISYLLHPPLLDELGFASATRWFAKGFAQRSRIKVNLNVPARLERLPSAIELALFRVLQEALTNVHRHAQADSLDIRVEKIGTGISLQVRDYGRGIPAERLQHLRESGRTGGVGFASMQERVRELGGILQISSNGKGTTVRADIPVLADSSTGAHSALV